MSKPARVVTSTACVPVSRLPVADFSEQKVEGTSLSCQGYHFPMITSKAETISKLHGTFLFLLFTAWHTRPRLGSASLPHSIGPFPSLLPKIAPPVPLPLRSNPKHSLSMEASRTAAASTTTRASSWVVSLLLLIRTEQTRSRFSCWPIENPHGSFAILLGVCVFEKKRSRHVKKPNKEQQQLTLL